MKFLSDHEFIVMALSGIQKTVHKTVMTEIEIKHLMLTVAHTTVVDDLTIMVHWVLIG